MVKNLPAVQEMRIRSLDREDPLEKEMVTHFSILAWEMPWTEESGRLQFHGVAKSLMWLGDLHLFSLLYLIPRAAIKKYYKLDSLKQQKCILSQFWRSEVWNRSVSRATCPTRLWRESWSHPGSGGSWHSLAYGIITPGFASASAEGLALWVALCSLFFFKRERATLNSRWFLSLF